MLLWKADGDINEDPLCIVVVMPDTQHQRLQLCSPLVLVLDCTQPPFPWRPINCHDFRCILWCQG